MSYNNTKQKINYLIQKQQDTINIKDKKNIDIDSTIKKTERSIYTYNKKIYNYLSDYELLEFNEDYFFNYKWKEFEIVIDNFPIRLIDGIEVYFDFISDEENDLFLDDLYSYFSDYIVQIYDYEPENEELLDVTKKIKISGFVFMYHSPVYLAKGRMRVFIYNPSLLYY